MRLAVVIPIGVLLLGPTASLLGAGQSLIPNSGFEQDLSGWTAAPETSATWSALDASGSSTSGSVLLTNTGTDGLPEVKLSQCVPVENPTVGFALRYRFRVPSGQDQFVRLEVQMSAFGNAECTGTAYGGVSPGAGGSPGGSGTWTDPVVFDEWHESRVQFHEFAPDWQTESVLVTLVVSDAPAGRDARVYFDEISLSPLERSTIPASASLPGRNGLFFRTDLSLFNASRSTARVDLDHHCFAGQPCRPAAIGDDRVVSIPPRSTIVLPDVLAARLYHSGTAGALELTHDSSLTLVAHSRVYSSSSLGATIGTTIPALRAQAAHSRSVLVPLSSSGGSPASGFRTNIGVFNPNDSPVDVTIRLFASTGDPVGAPLSRSWARRESFQMDDVFSSFNAGAETLDGAFIVVESSAPVFSYAIVIDNQSGDPTFIQGVDDSHGAP